MEDWGFDDPPPRGPSIGDLRRRQEYEDRLRLEKEALAKAAEVEKEAASRKMGTLETLIRGMTPAERHTLVLFIKSIDEETVAQSAPPPASEPGRYEGREGFAVF